MQRMKEIMDSLHNASIKEIGGLKVTAVTDYIKSTTTTAEGAVTPITLPKSDVITFSLEDDASVIIRPSGTEPKIKAYYTTKGKTKDEAVELQGKLAADFTKILGF